MDFDKEQSIFIGYHGTDNTCSQSILSENFRVSDNDDWVGKGAYFFVEGLYDPIKAAKEWAISRANRYSKKDKCYTLSYPRYAVIESLITTDQEKVLDLVCAEGRKGYAKFKECILEDACRRGIALTTRERHNEGLIVDELCEKYSMDIVLSELVITTSEYSLKQRVTDKIPNKTVIAVRAPSERVHLDQTRVAEEGDVERWT